MTRRIGRYEILRVIGRGSMATVYLARQIDLDRQVALKELTLFDGDDPEPARRMLREARLAGSLSHRNIVTVHDHLQIGGTPYIAMEYVAGGSLRSRVGRLSLPQIGGVLEGVLGGLAHAERHRVVHRDLKPENVLVTTEGWVKIADFGIAKATGGARSTASLTAAGTTLGAPRYMAPERAMGQDVGPWSDLYSVGVMVFELLVGRTPFHETTAPMEILMRQVNDPVPPVASLVPGTDPALSGWVQHLLEKDPARRLRSAATAWDELDEILRDQLGTLWIRDALLVAPSAAPAERTAGRPTTAQSGESRQRRTVAPATIPLSPVARREPRRGRRRPPARRLALFAAALVVAAAAAMARSGGDPGRPATAMPDRVAPAATPAGTPGIVRSEDPSDDEPDEDEPDENED